MAADCSGRVFVSPLDLSVDLDLKSCLLVVDVLITDGPKESDAEIDVKKTLLRDLEGQIINVGQQTLILISCVE